MSREQLETKEHLAHMREMAMIARQYMHPSRFYGQRGEFAMSMERAAKYLSFAISSRDMARNMGPWK